MSVNQFLFGLTGDDGQVQGPAQYLGKVVIRDKRTPPLNTSVHHDWVSSQILDKRCAASLRDQKILHLFTINF